MLDIKQISDGDESSNDVLSTLQPLMQNESQGNVLDKSRKFSVDLNRLMKPQPKREGGVRYDLREEARVTLGRELRNKMGFINRHILLIVNHLNDDDFLYGFLHAKSANKTDKKGENIELNTAEIGMAVDLLRSNGIKETLPEKPLEYSFDETLEKSKLNFHIYFRNTEAFNGISIDVNGGKYDHHGENDQGLCASELVWNNRKNIPEEKEENIASHEAPDPDSIILTSLYFMIKNGLISQEQEKAVERLAKYAHKEDYAEWNDKNFDDMDLQYLLSRIKGYLRGNNTVQYKVGYEIIKRILEKDLNPNDLKAEDLEEISMQVSEKKRIKVSDIAEKFRKNRIKSMASLNNSEEITTDDDRVCLFCERSSLDLFEMYEMGYSIVVNGDGIYTCPEYAKKIHDKLINLYNNMNKKEESDNKWKHGNGYSFMVMPHNSSIDFLKLKDIVKNFFKSNE